MFALRNSLQRSVAPAVRRFAAVPMPKNPLVPEVYQYNFKQSWLSDPSTYPIIMIMTLATTFMIGMSGNALARYKGVKILPEHKNAIMNDWDSPDEKSMIITERLTRNTLATHWRSAWKSIRYEGLGVDHEEWKKQKEAEVQK